MKRITFIYLTSYLLAGGLGLMLIPAFTLDLFQSNGAYGDIMPRVVGMFMIGLGGIIFLFLRRRDFTYYAYSIYIRSFFVLFLFFLYFRSNDPLFLVLNTVVLIGLLPSIWTFAREGGAKGPAL